MTPLTLLLLAALPTPQVLIGSTHGEDPLDGHGWTVAGLSDLDGDGYPDYAVGVYKDDTAGTNAGAVHVVSGLEGQILYTLYGTPSEGSIPFGWSLDVLGDLDGDGHDDFVVGFPDDASLIDRAGSVRVYSGIDGTELLAAHGEYPFARYGYDVAAAGDVNADGVPDIITGTILDATVATQAGRVQVLSGVDASVLREWFGTESFGKFGSAVAGAGDIDGDGFDDLIVGAENEGGNQTGRAYVYSGADGSELLRWEAAASYSLFGATVDGIGDVSGDGVPDVVIAAVQRDYVHVCSGADGALLYELTSSESGPTWGFGISLDGRMDVDGDGVRDLLVGSDHEARVYGYSGASGTELFRVDAPHGGGFGSEFGWSSSWCPPIAGADMPGFVVGHPANDVGEQLSGSAFQYALDAFWTNYCETTPNSVGPGALIGMTGDLSIATNATRLNATGCPPNQSAIFYYGPERRNLPFGNGRRCVGGAIYRLAVFTTGGTGTPSYLLDFGSPPAPSGQILPGSRWRFQCWYRDPSGGGSLFNLSDGAEAWFKP